MLKKLLVFVILITVTSLKAQDIKRVEIKGKVVVDTDEKEGITVYNTSANKGTITDENGNFKIMATLNDVVVFGALQFKDFTVRIDERILDSKQLVVYLVEDVNKLDEVLVLPYDLSGSLKADLKSVRTYNVDIDSIYSGMQDFDDYEFSADYKTAVYNPSVDEQLPYMDNGLNIINLFGLFVGPSKKKKEKLQDEEKKRELLERYKPSFLKRNFNIPINKAEAFLEFVNTKTIDIELFNEEREIELLELLLAQSKVFLNTKSDKN